MNKKERFIQVLEKSEARFPAFGEMYGVMKRHNCDGFFCEELIVSKLQQLGDDKRAEIEELRRVFLKCL